MTTIDFIGHVGYALLVVGMILVARKKTMGWLFRLTGEFIWAGLGLKLGLTSIWFWGVIFIMIDILAYCHWRISDENS